jgi:hypothetical protein
VVTCRSHVIHLIESGVVTMNSFIVVMGLKNNLLRKEKGKGSLPFSVLLKKHFALVLIAIREATCCQCSIQVAHFIIAEPSVVNHYGLWSENHYYSNREVPKLPGLASISNQFIFCSYS